MAKYSFEFKKKVVMSYLNGRDGYQSVAKQYGIASHNQVKKWVLSYQRHGNEG
jgi:transposase